jgi:hypothetical protein
MVRGTIGHPQLFGMGMPARPEERAAGQPGAMEVFLDRLGGGIMQAHGPAFAAFFL